MKLTKIANVNKFKLSLIKKDWLRIGINKKWIKLAEEDSIEINGKQYIRMEGKWYNENLEEVPNPQPKRYTVEKYGITFVEEGEYLNWFGIYRVKKINDDKTMDVEYLQSFKPEVAVGEIKRYTMLAQAETIYRANRSKEIEMRLNHIAEFKSPDDFFTMGFIAKNGYLSAEIGPKYHKSFPSQYKQLTGEDPSIYLEKGYKLSTNENRWSYTLRVHLPASIPPQILEKLSLPNLKIREAGAEVNDNAFVWGLFNKGFSIGRNDKKASKIKSFLSLDAHDAFEKGFNVL